MARRNIYDPGGMILRGVEMRIRIGKVTNIYPAGKVKVVYEDEGNTSLPLSMLTMNQEYSMPAVGDRVVTMHMENGSSKGFVFGTYYGGGMKPKANAGYRKDFESGAFAICKGGAYQLSAESVSVKGGSKACVSGGGAAVSLNGDASLVGANVTIGSAVAAGNENSGEAEPDVYLKITEESAEMKAISEIVLESDAYVSIQAASATVEADEITLKCSYGTITVEEMMKRLERIEDQLGLPHAI